MDIKRLREKCQGFAGCFDAIEKRVTLCATEAIDTAMSEKNPNWFSAFKGKELKLTQYAIIERRHENIRDLDFQAAIKLFLYRESKVDWAEGLDLLNISAVFAKYELPRTYAAEKPSRFKKLVGNLINRRNELTGHLSAEEIEAETHTASEKELEDIIFKYRESIQDLISFLSYFPELKGVYPVSHFEYAKQLLDYTEKKYNIEKHSIAEVIEKEGLSIDEKEFADICLSIKLNTSTENGIMYFETDNYPRDIQIIAAMAESRAAAVIPEEKPNYLPAIAVIATLLLVLVILLMLLIPKLNSKSTGENESSSQNDHSIIHTTIPSGNSNGSSSNGSEGTSKKGKIKGETSVGMLDLAIDQRPSTSFAITIKNNGGTTYSLGWVQKAQVVIETSEKTYYSTLYERPSTHINPGSTTQVSINMEEQLEGEIEKITIKNIIPLSASGLPEQSDTTGLTAIINIEYY